MCIRVEFPCSSSVLHACVSVAPLQRRRCALAPVRSPPPGVGYADMKEELAALLEAKFAPARVRYDELLLDPDGLDNRWRRAQNVPVRWGMPRIDKLRRKLGFAPLERALRLPFIRVPSVCIRGSFSPWTWAPSSPAPVALPSARC